ncbi:MAG TPA: hypothetical protein VN911_03505 [Candidatus Acidoferrum sp.]|nr:hypothetical protein [Candidatus Acidoferrum sp.]
MAKYACHPEQSEGPWFFLTQPVSWAYAQTKVPRFARDDSLDATHLIYRFTM